MEDEILSLVLDAVHVVSYKWLSRKFSISSNEAKRLLQIIADQHGSRVEVVYVVSGWSKTNKNFYSVQLVPKSKLHEATDLLDGHISVHVYSVQPAIPKDPAELWAAEYAQSHELFEQDPELSNCLRDNRFSAVTCTSISCKRLGDSGSGQKDISKSSFKSSALSKNLVNQELHTAVGISKSADKQDSSKLTEKHVLKPTSHEENDSKVPEKHALVHESSINITDSKETTTKKGSGGGIANLWGRASTKTKPLAAHAHVESAAKIEVQEETKAQAQAHDVSLGESSEDDASDFMHVRRGQPKQNNGRTRRMVIDDEMSDDGEGNAQNVISLSSPDVPSKKKPCSVSDKETQGTNTLKEKRKKRIEDTRSSPEIDPPSLHEDGKQARDNASLGTIDEESHTESNVEEERVPTVKRVGNEAKAEQMLPPQLITNNGALQSVKKRRKILKTNIDDHGREVTEVVLENDSDGANSEDKTDGAVNTNAHRDASSKVPDNKTFGNKDPQKPLSNKTISSNPKAAKGPTSKDPQQGKISSFFKKKN